VCLFLKSISLFTRAFSYAVHHFHLLTSVSYLLFILFSVKVGKREAAADEATADAAAKLREL